VCPLVEVVEDVGAVLWKLHVVDRALNNGVEDDATAWIRKKTGNIIETCT
jgi:hypothetical protein